MPQHVKGQAMPDDLPAARRISLELPADLVDAFDRIAAALGRPRAWLIERALRGWLDDEGAELLEDTDSLAELDRGEFVSSENLHQKLCAIIDRAENSRAPPK